MAYDSLRAFIGRLDRSGELRRVKGAVDPYLEISEIADRTMKLPDGGPALLFENVVGSCDQINGLLGAEMSRRAITAETKLVDPVYLMPSLSY